MQLPKRLFWDIDPSTLDWHKNARFIIQRVIQRGSIEEWKVLKDVYGLPFIKNEILKIRTLDPKTFHFFAAYFDIQKTDFRCFTTRQSIPKHFNY